MTIEELCSKYWPEHPWFIKPRKTIDGLHCGHNVRLPGLGTFVYLYRCEVATCWDFPNDGWKTLYDAWLPIIACVAAMHWENKAKANAMGRADVRVWSHALEAAAAWSELAKGV